MVSYSDEQIKNLILEDFADKKVSILAPVVRSRKGHYRELFEQIAKQGFVKVRVDGVVREIISGMKVDRYKNHDIEIVIDRLKIPSNSVEDDSKENLDKRLSESINTAMYHGDDVLQVLDNDSGEARYFSRSLMCPSSGISYPNPEPNNFSFNSPKGMCPRCKGLGKLYEVNLQKLVPDPKLSIKKGALAPHGPQKNNWIFKQLELIAERYGFKLTDTFESIPKEAKEVIFFGGNEQVNISSKTLGITRNYKIDFEGVATFIQNTFDANESKSLQRWAKEYMDKIACPECGGTRLRKESLYFKVNDKNIAELANMDVVELAAWFKDLENNISETQLKIASEIIKEVRTRLQFLVDVGLTYLALDRGSKSLSGGEAQRIRLATQIGSQLVGVLYILDEPSIGLHQRDNERLINSLKNLRDIGNSVLVVEHDKDMILQADYVIDMGPEAGINGGKVVTQGTPEELMKADTLTAQYLNGQKEVAIPTDRRKGNGKMLSLKGASGN